MRLRSLVRACLFGLAFLISGLPALERASAASARRDPATASSRTVVKKKIKKKKARPVAVRHAAARPAPVPAAQPAARGWLVTVNAKASVSPRYGGSDKYSAIGFPTLSFRRPGAPPTWSSPDDSLDYSLFSSGSFSAGPVVAYRGGRYDKGNPDLRGVHNARWTLEPGLFADVWVVPAQLRARFEARRGFREEDGFTGKIGIDWVIQKDRLTVAVGPRLDLGDGRFMRKNFGITSADTLANPRFATYRPTGGIVSAGLFGSLTYKYSDQWSMTLHGGWDRLQGQAAKSPIVTVSGNRNQFTFGAVLSYTFGWGM